MAEIHFSERHGAGENLRQVERAITPRFIRGAGLLRRCDVGVRLLNECYGDLSPTGRNSFVRCPTIRLKVIAKHAMEHAGKAQFWSTGIVGELSSGESVPRFRKR